MCLKTESKIAIAVLRDVFLDPETKLPNGSIRGMNSEILIRWFAVKAVEDSV